MTYNTCVKNEYVPYKSSLFIDNTIAKIELEDS